MQEDRVREYETEILIDVNEKMSTLSDMDKLVLATMLKARFDYMFDKLVEKYPESKPMLDAAVASWDYVVGDTDQTPEWIKEQQGSE